MPYTGRIGTYIPHSGTVLEKVDLDLRANSAYWAKYEDTVVSTVSNKVNDTYLKANAQADGVKSYGRMVDLLLQNTERIRTRQRTSKNRKGLSEKLNSSVKLNSSEKTKFHFIWV
jgi:hypothetical protein